MSLPNQSIDKNKRYAGVKANDFVNKTRTTETSRATARTQGWANLGKASGRRVPPPANVPSLKSETGIHPSAFDPTIPTGTSHGWTASGNPTTVHQTRPLTPSKQPTQQQIDSLSAHSSSTPPPPQSSADLEKPRLPATWSTVTAGSNPNGNANDQPPNLLALNDFPRLATQDNKSQKSPSDSLVGSISSSNQGPSLRPANLASWKEGGGRAQSLSTDTTKDANDNSLSMQSQVVNTNPNSLHTQLPNPSYMRMYQQPQQMWSHNAPHSYGNNQTSTSMSTHHPQTRVSSYGTSNQSHNSQRLNTSTDYKTPTILRNKDIDDLSKLTDNVTWASASQEVNYEEKIRFSDDEDNETVDSNHKSRRFNQSRPNYPQVLQNTNRSLQTTRSRLLQDDEHVKQMQDDKNSELINALTVAKQRREEQERHLRDQRPTASNNQNHMPGYQTRPLLTSTEQEKLSSSQTDASLWNQTSSGPTTVPRTRHDTADSQTFAMKSWSDQMDSFNYASLHEKSGGQADANDDPPAVSTSRARKYSRSASESSSHSHPDHNSTQNRSKHFPLPNRKPNKSNVSQVRIKSKTTDVIDYFENNEPQSKSNDQWGDWEESHYPSNNRYQQTYSNDRRRQQPSADDLSQKSNRYGEQTNDYNRTKQSVKARSNVSRSSDMAATSTKTENKSQPVWRALSPTRPIETNDPTPQEAITYKSQTKSIESTDRRQTAPTERKSRYNTSSTTINTASIPPLMSVRSDIPLPTVSSSANVANSKHFKTSNQSQRQDYNTSSHYSQRKDFYNETNDSAWGNDDDYYEDETGYYDPNLQTHQRHSQAMGYQTHSHHRGYTTLGSYGRYRRGGTLRHQQQQQQCTTYNTNSPSSTSSQLNTSTGSKTKKSVVNRTTALTSKKVNESLETIKAVEEPEKLVPDEPMQKPSPWTTEPKSSTVEEIPIVITVETPSIFTAVEKAKDLSSEQKPDNEPATLGQRETDSTSTNKKFSTTYSQKKWSKDQQNYHPDQRYQNQQALGHRNTYGHSAQDYEATMQMPSHHYFAENRRTTRGGRNARMHDLSSGYYYEHPQQRYNNRYNYSTDHYQEQSSSRSANRTAKRGNSATATTDRSLSKGQTNTGNANMHQQSVSDNEQKEGEEWETASESSTNMRNNHPENSQQTKTNETNPDRTPPKKSFSSQRPLTSRHNENTIHRRGYNLYERGSKSNRGMRSSRLTTNQKAMPSHENDEDSLSNKQGKKDQHRHSLDGYDLNNVAGVVKIETLPASALEEESTVFDDGGEEFCVVMSKRGRKEQKAAQLSKQNAVELPTDLPVKSASIDTDDQPTKEKSSTESNPNNSTRTRSGKSLPPRFNSKSSTRQAKTEHSDASMYYYDQNYYYYDQNQYYDHDGFYYNYNQSTQRPSSTRRKTRNPPHSENNPPIETRKVEVEKTSSNVMSNIQMWNPHMDNTISNSSKLIEKPTHERKFASEIVPSSSNDGPLPLPLTTHSSISKTNETLARTIKPPMVNNKSEREAKSKASNYEKTNTISSLGSNQLFEKSTFLDYDDKQSIGTVGDDYNQKINSLKTIWDASDQAGQLEQTINTMVAMKQHQDNSVQSTNSSKGENYIKESIPISSSGANANVSLTTNDDVNNKNPSVNANLQSTGSSSTINQSTTYSSNSNPNKNEAKNICTVKPTQQVPPNIQDQVDVSAYQTFAPPPLAPTMSQASLQQQHILPQSQVNPLHQQHTYPFYDNLLPPPPPPQQQQAQQQQFGRIYSSITTSASTDEVNSDFSSAQSSAIYPPQNFSYRNTNVYMSAPPPNTNSMYHHTSQAPQQNNAMPPPMPNYPSPFLVDPGGHMISQPQPPQGYMNNQMMSGRPQAGPYYRNPPQQQLQNPPGPPYGSQDQLAHGGYYPPYFQQANSNAPPVGHPSPHNLYGQNDGFHHPQMFARGGSIDRGDHSLMSQPLSRPTNYPSTSSNPPPSGAPPSLLSQNLKSFHTNPQQTSSSNQASFYPPPPPNQFNRQPMPIGAMNNTNNRQQTQQVPSLMSGLSKNFSNNGNNTQPLFPHRQPLLPPQSTNNRPLYPQHNQYSTYSKSTAPNDDNVKPKHI